MPSFHAWLRRYIASFGAAKRLYNAEPFIANVVAVLLGILRLQLPYGAPWSGVPA